MNLKIIMGADEIMYLHNVVRSLGKCSVVELGRYVGGSTYIIAAAMLNGSKLSSYDNHSKLETTNDGETIDNSLDKYINDSFPLKTINIALRKDERKERIDLLFIDANHSYEHVLFDFNDWSKWINKGGHVLFHDSITEIGVKKVINMVKKLKEYRLVKVVNTLTHFVKLR